MDLPGDADTRKAIEGIESVANRAVEKIRQVVNGN